MQILKQVTKTVKKEIGNLDGKVRLPTASRISCGMKTKCDACGKEITDEFFVGGFKTGLPNLKLHERCAP